MHTTSNLQVTVKRDVGAMEEDEHLPQSMLVAQRKYKSSEQLLLLQTLFSNGTLVNAVWHDLHSGLLLLLFPTLMFIKAITFFIAETSISIAQSKPHRGQHT